MFYRAPCGRRLRNLDEVDTFLDLTKSGLSIDNFCCDSELHVHHEFIPVKVRTVHFITYIHKSCHIYKFMQQRCENSFLCHYPWQAVCLSATHLCHLKAE